MSASPMLAISSMRLRRNITRKAETSAKNAFMVGMDPFLCHTDVSRVKTAGIARCSVAEATSGELEEDILQRGRMYDQMVRLDGACGGGVQEVYDCTLNIARVD